MMVMEMVMVIVRDGIDDQAYCAGTRRTTQDYAGLRAHGRARNARVVHCVVICMQENDLA